MKLPVFSLEDYLAEREFNCDIMFSGSDMETFAMHDLLASAKAETLNLWNNLKLSYTQPKGHPLLLSELYLKYNMTSDSEQICTFNGAEEAIYTLLINTLAKEDHVIVITPCYQSLKEIPKNICEVSELKIKFNNDEHKIDLNELEYLIKSNTKMIITNFPHNPTGFILGKNEFDYLITIARKNNLYLFSDEVYRGLEINATDQLPSCASIYEKGISLGVMSKSYGLPGIRIGWIACQDKKIIAEISKYKYYLTICNSAPSEILAIIALQNEDFIYSRNKKILNKNLVILKNFFNKYKNIFEWYEPKGGCIAFPKLKLNISSYEFCEKLSHSHKIQLLPGEVFQHDDNHFRVGYGRLNMPEAVSRLENFLQNL